MTIDVAAFQPQTGQTVYVAALFTQEHPGRLLTGPEKLVQRFVLELMTDTGTMLYRPTRGGNFLSLLQAIKMSEADVFYAFYNALLPTASNLQAEESDTDPDDERYGGATLSKIELAPGQYKLTIGVQTRSGVLVNLIWPISLTPRPEIQDFSALGVE